MNKLEAIIYEQVKNNPALKQLIVRVYQGILGLVPQQAISCDLPIVDRRGYFYGFHDKSPFSPDGRFLLAHRRGRLPYRSKRPDDAIEVGYFEGDDWSSYKPIGVTTGWNWQLGSMLQWMGASNDKIIYNVMAGQRHASVVKALDGRELAVYDWPVVHVSPDAAYACSYNFKRAEQAMPGYGIVTPGKEGLLNMESDTFKVFRCRDGQVVYELSLRGAATIHPHPSMEGAFHFFHHALFNPESQRVFFMHRWVDKHGRRWTRLFSVGVDGRELYLFPMDEMVSHITWASADTLFSYLRYPGQGDGYYLIEDKTGKATRFFAEAFNSDGHPTMDIKRGIVITDTYPDRFRNQYLALGFTADQRRVNLCRTHLPALFRDYLQVDLHPRLHPERPIACVDAAFHGEHSLLTLDFSSLMP